MSSARPRRWPCRGLNAIANSARAGASGPPPRFPHTAATTPRPTRTTTTTATGATTCTSSAITSTPPARLGYRVTLIPPDDGRPPPGPDTAPAAAPARLAAQAPRITGGRRASSAGAAARLPCDLKFHYSRDISDARTPGTGVRKTARPRHRWFAGRYAGAPTSKWSPAAGATRHRAAQRLGEPVHAHGTAEPCRSCRTSSRAGSRRNRSASPAPWPSTTARDLGD